MAHSAHESDVTVYIYEDGNGAVPRAEPGRVVIRRGQSVVWKNLTASHLRLAFPSPEIFDGGVGQGDVRVPPGGESRELEVSEKDEHRGAHPYLAVLRRGQTGPSVCVEGGSHPVMIID